jgi:cytidylate kinase
MQLAVSRCETNTIPAAREHASREAPMENRNGEETLVEMVEKQVKKWNARNRRREARRREEHERPMPVIAVSREAGTLGRVVAERVAEELGYTLYAEDMISLIAKRAHVNEASVLALDEKGRSYVYDLLEQLNRKYCFQSGNYFETLVKTIAAINWQGRGVILGRGGALMVRGRKGNLAVRFTAPLEWRIEHMAERLEITEDEARSRIHEIDSARRAFIRSYFNTRIDDPQHFDLVINNEFMDVEDSVAIIRTALAKKTEDAAQTASGARFLSGGDRHRERLEQARSGEGHGPTPS